MEELQNQDVSLFESAVGISFADKQLLKTAFTHRSYLNERKGDDIEHNERLEFLGDAVLELIVTDFLFHSFPEEKEGMLTAYRAALVNTESLAETAAALSMDDYLRMSKGERMDTEKGRMHILANTFESFIGALFLDQGTDMVTQFLHTQLFPKIETIVEQKLFRDAKSFFQEKSQELKKITPHYELVAHEGPDHDKEFVMAVFLGDEKIAEGRGLSKQKAETDAAVAGLAQMGWD